MFPIPEQIEESFHLPAGNLHDVPFPVVLAALAAHKQTAMLELTRRQVSKTVVLEAGVPVDCRSNLLTETRGRFVFPDKPGQEESYEDAVQALVLPGNGAREAAAGREAEERLAKKLLDLFTWQEGEYHVEPATPGPAPGAKLKVPQLILTGVTRLVPQQEVDAAMVALVGKKLVLHPAPYFPLEELRLNPHQTRAVEALRAGCRIDELALSTGFDFEEITRLLYALTVLGVVVTADRLPRGAAAPPTGALPLPPLSQAALAAAPPASAAPAAHPAVTAPVETAKDRADLEQRRNKIALAFPRLGNQDALQILELPEEASRYQIDERFLVLARTYAPWTLVGELASLEDKARMLFLSLARAYAELADVEQRQALLFRRRTLREEREKKPVDLKIKTDLLDPRVQFRKGIALREAGKYREAAMQLEFAADCDPQNATYGAELAYTRFLFSPGSAARLARDLAEALRLDPECGIAYFYDGELKRHLGRPVEAEESYRKAIKLMSPDRRPIDALKSLSSAGSKKV